MIRNGIFASIFLAATSMCSHQPADPPTQKLDNKCYPSYANSDKQVCEVSLYAVIADPSQYEGRTIKITGYMKRVLGVPVVYPSRDAYVYSAGRGGVELLVGNQDSVEIMIGKDEIEGATTVIGRFTTEVNGRVRGSVGVIAGNITVFPEHEPGQPPPMPIDQ